MENNIKLNDGTYMPTLGQGAWNMEENPARRFEEIRALRKGVLLGMTLIDTAEMYGEGLSEELVGEAIKTFEREDLFLVSKVYPQNAGRKDIFDSCKKSLERLDTPYLDLYLLHWRGTVPLEETVACMEELKEQGLIKNWGVSNFDTDDIEELLSIHNGTNCRVNQVLYHLGSRGVEYDLLPLLKAQGIATMAYCPLAHNEKTRKEIASSTVVTRIAKRLDISPEQVMLAFLLAQNQVCAIPKAATLNHVIDNAHALHVLLGEEDLNLLETQFPAPTSKMPLDVL